MTCIQNKDGILQQFMRQQIGVLFGFACFADQPRHDIGCIFNTLGPPTGNQRVEISQKIAHGIFAGGELVCIDFGLQRTKNGK